MGSVFYMWRSKSSTNQWMLRSSIVFQLSAMIKYWLPTEYHICICQCWTEWGAVSVPFSVQNSKTMGQIYWISRTNLILRDMSTSVRLQNLPWYKTAPKPALCLLQNRLCACSKTGFVPTLNPPLQNRFCACSKTGFVPTLNQPLQNRLCACSKTSFVPSLNLLHQNRLCTYAQPAARKPALHRH